MHAHSQNSHNRRESNSSSIDRSIDGDDGNDRGALMVAVAGCSGTAWHRLAGHGVGDERAEAVRGGFGTGGGVLRTAG